MKKGPDLRNPVNYNPTPKRVNLRCLQKQKTSIFIQPLQSPLENIYNNKSTNDEIKEVIKNAKE